MTIVSRTPHDDLQAGLRSSRPSAAIVSICFNDRVQHGFQCRQAAMNVVKGSYSHDLLGRYISLTCFGWLPLSTLKSLMRKSIPLPCTRIQCSYALERPLARHS